MKADRFAEAEEVYREDLRRLPENGWSLYGLAGTFEGSKKSRKPPRWKRVSKKAWAKADIQINSSCFAKGNGGVFRISQIFL